MPEAISRRLWPFSRPNSPISSRSELDEEQGIELSDFSPKREVPSAEERVRSTSSRILRPDGINPYDQVRLKELYDPQVRSSYDLNKMLHAKNARRKNSFYNRLTPKGKMIYMIVVWLGLKLGVYCSECLKYSVRPKGHYFRDLKAGNLKEVPTGLKYVVSWLHKKIGMKVVVNMIWKYAPAAWRFVNHYRLRARRKVINGVKACYQFVKSKLQRKKEVIIVPTTPKAVEKRMKKIGVSKARRVGGMRVKGARRNRRRLSDMKRKKR